FDFEVSVTQIDTLVFRRATGTSWIVFEGNNVHIVDCFRNSARPDAPRQAAIRLGSLVGWTTSGCQPAIRVWQSGRLDHARLPGCHSDLAVWSPAPRQAAIRAWQSGRLDHATLSGCHSGYATLPGCHADLAVWSPEPRHTNLRHVSPSNIPAPSSPT